MNLEYQGPLSAFSDEETLGGKSHLRSQEQEDKRERDSVLG